MKILSYMKREYHAVIVDIGCLTIGLITMRGKKRILAETMTQDLHDVYACLPVKYFNQVIWLVFL